MKEKVIISAAITGSVHTPTMSPYLPITPEEIANEAILSWEAGAAVAHIHARDPKTGMPSADLSLFEQIISKIKDKTDMIICTTTGGGAGMTVEQRLAVVPKFKPELASFNMGSMNFSVFPVAEKIREWKTDWEKTYLEDSKGAIFKNTFEDLEQICITMNENNTKPELEIYDVGQLYNTAFMVKRGFLKLPLYLQFVTGILGGIESTIYDLVHLKNTADRILGNDNFIWSAFGAGRNEFPICTHSILMGGNCRVGLEDNLYIQGKKFAKSNAQLVKKMAGIIKEFDMEPASVEDAKEILNL